MIYATGKGFPYGEDWPICDRHDISHSSCDLIEDFHASHDVVTHINNTTRPLYILYDDRRNKTEHQEKAIEECIKSESIIIMFYSRITLDSDTVTYSHSLYPILQVRRLSAMTKSTVNQSRPGRCFLGLVLLGSPPGCRPATVS